MISQAFSYLPSSSFQHSAKATPLFFVICRAHDCLDALPMDRFGALQSKHVKGKSPGSAESKDANSK